MRSIFTAAPYWSVVPTNWWTEAGSGLAVPILVLDVCFVPDSRIDPSPILRTECTVTFALLGFAIAVSRYDPARRPELEDSRD